MSDKAMLFDTSRCTGCHACQVACKCWNNLPSPLNAPGSGDLPGPERAAWTGTHQNPPDLNGYTRLIMTYNEVENPGFGAGDVTAPLATKQVRWAFGRRSCQHCTDAPCAQTCPAGALYVDGETGMVTHDQSLCIGCQNCQAACPFDVPRYDDVGRIDPVINKCYGCVDRIAAGMAPACVTTCQPGALSFGERDAMIEQAHAQVERLHERGYEDAVVYGEEEMGGLHVIQVLKYGVEAHGQVSNPTTGLATTLHGLAKPVTGVLAGAVFVALAGMTALSAGSERHEQVAYNPETGDTLDLETGEVIKQGDGQGTKTFREYLSQVPLFKRWGEDADE